MNRISWPTLLLVVALLSSAAHAGTVRTWSGNGPDNNFTTAANWVGNNPPGNNDSVVFPAGSPRLNPVLNNAGGLSLNLITFDDAGYVLSGNLITLTNPGAGGGISLSVAGAVTIANNIDNKANTQLDFVTVAGATINVTGVLSSSNNKEWGVSGGGVTVISGNNTYTRAMTVYTGGTLIVTSNNALGTTATATTVQTGATLAFAGNVNYATTEQILLQGGTVNNDSGTNTFAGTIAMSADSFIGATAGSLTLSGVISGAFNLTKNGAGTDILTASNTYTGTTTVSAGTLIVGSNNALGTNAGGTSVTAGASLGIQGGTNYATAEALTINGAGVGGVGAFYNVSGNNTYTGAITLASDSTIGSTAGTLTASGGINNGGFVLTTDGAGNITESGVISGAGDLVKDGTGTLQLSGAGSNTFTGTTTVNTGTLQLNKTAGLDAILGPLVIGDDAGGNNADIVQLLAANQIDDSATVTVNSSGLLNLNGFAETIGNAAGSTFLTLESGTGQGGSVSIGASTLTMGGDIALVGAAGDNTGGDIATGTLALGAASRTITVADTAAVADLSITSVISGGAGVNLTKAGAGTLVLNAVNTYSGLTTVSAGVLNIQNASALGATGTGTVVNAGATLQVQGTIAVGVEALTLNGTGTTALPAAAAVAPNPGALESVSGTNSWAGAVTLASDSSVGVTAGQLTMSGVIGGGGNDLGKVGTGTLTMTGNSNTYTGTTTVYAGTLELSKTAGQTAIAGPLVIGDDDGTANNDVVRLLVANQIANTSAVTVTSSGLLALNNFAETIAGLTMNSGTTSGASVTTGTATLTLGGDVALNVFGTGATGATISGGAGGTLALGATRTFTIANGTAAQDLTVSTIISGAGFGITKDGAGTLQIAGTASNTYNGTTTVNTGVLELNKTAGLNAIAGPLVVGDAVGGASADVARLLASNQILDTQAVTVRNSGLLDLNGFNETITAATALTLETGAASGAAVTTGAGTLTLGGDVLLNTVVADTVGATISGNVSLNGGVRIFNVSDSNAVADLSVSAVISNGSLTKQGAGTLVLSGANTYAGATLVSAGVLNVQNATALGATAAGTTVSAGATIQIQGNTAIGAEALTLSGTGTTALPSPAAVAPNPGALESVSGTNSWAGNVTLAAASSIGVTAGQLTLSGVIGGGALALTKVGNGTLTMTGNSNTYTGTTTVVAGTLELNKAAGQTAIAGPLIVGDNDGTPNNDVVRLLAGDQIANATAVTVTNSGLLDLNNFSDAISTLTVNSGATSGGNTTLGTGTLTLGGDVTLNVTATGAVGGTITGAAGGALALGATRTFTINDGTAAQDLTVSAAITGAGFDVNKAGTGTLQYAGGSANTYSGATNVNSGTLELNKTAADGAIAGVLNIGNNDGTAANDVVRLLAGNQIANASAVTVTNSGLFDLNNFSDAIGTLTMNSGATSGASATLGTGTLTLGGNVTLNVTATGANGATITAAAGGAVALGATRTFTVNDGTAAQDLTVSAAITGAGFGVDKAGTGTLQYAGGSANTYTGITTVSAGVLELNKGANVDAIVGPLVVGDNGGGNDADVVRLLASGQINDGAAVTIASSGVLNLSGNNETIGNVAGATFLTLQSGAGIGATLTTGAGTLTLGGDVAMTGVAGDNTGADIVGSVSLGAATRTFSVADSGAGTDLLVSGSISGGAGAGLTKTGTGTLTYSGAANTYVGTTTVNAGVLLLNKAANIDAIVGPLLIGDGAGGNDVDVVRLNAAGQINDGAAITVASSGLLDLNGNAETLGNLAGTVFITLQSGGASGGTVTTGAGTLTLGGDVALTGLAGDAVGGDISGTLALGAVSRTFTVANTGATADLTVSAIVGSTGGGITKAGAGTLVLTNANTYAGLTDITAGIVNVQNATGLGTVAAGTSVTAGATLQLQGGIAVGAEALTLNGAGVGALGALESVSGNNSFAGAITLASASTIGSDTAGNTLTLSSTIDNGGFLQTVTGAGNTIESGVVSGAGGLTKNGTGTLTLSGAAANTYTGITTVNTGELDLNKAAGNAVAGALSIGDGAGGANADILRLLAANQIADTSALTLASSGVLILTNFNETVGAFSGSGNVQLGNGAANTFTVGDAANTIFSGVISGTDAGDQFVKAGTGTLRLTGANTLAGSTSVSAGTLLANNAAGSATGTGAVTVQNTATLGGTGAITGAITVQNGGTLSPGDGGTQDLNVGALTMQAGSTFFAEINSGTASTGYDQVIASGAVALGNSTLSLSLGYVPADADVITLINNTGAGAVAGTFNGYAEGGTVLTGAEAFQISYVGGTGNDVVLRPQPRVINVTSTKANGTYGTGEVIDITVQFNRSVTVTGTPQLTLETGASDAVVNYFSGSGTDTLTFRYTVAVGHTSPDLDYISTAALALNGGTIKSTPGIDAYLALPAPGAAGSLGFNKNIVIISLAVITARETVDADGDGRIDAIRIVTDVNLNDNFAGLGITVAGFVLAGAPYDTGGTANDNEFFIRLVENALPPDTGDTNATPLVTVTASGSLGLQTDAGVAATDKAKPVLLAAQWNNVGSGDGVDAGDTVTLTFSEPVTTVGALIADIGLPVTNDTWATSTIANQGPSTTIDILLAGAMRLTPAGTYSVAALTAGSPTGVFIADGTRIRDGAAVFNTALNQGFGTAVDLRPGGRIISIVWANTHTFERRTWDVSTDADYGATYRASTATAPPVLRVANSGTGRERFDMFCMVSEPSGWSMGAAAGIDTFEMKVDPTPPSAFSLDLATGPKQLAGQLYSGQEASFDLQLVTPTEITTGTDIEQNITVTIVATQD